LRLRGIFVAMMAWFVRIALLGLTNNLTDLTRGPLGMTARSFLMTTSNLPNSSVLGTQYPSLHLVIYGVLMILVMVYYTAGLSGVDYCLKDKLFGGRKLVAVEMQEMEAGEGRGKSVCS
jgi:ABC-type branched-subunit amino acid transport system permease subunit